MEHKLIILLTILAGRLGNSPSRQSWLYIKLSQLLWVFLSFRWPDARWDLWSLFSERVIRACLGGRWAGGQRKIGQVKRGLEGWG